ncbi:hypothetical protein ES703_111139 [subsurface metagenome]|jgi:hypothetical protein
MQISLSKAEVLKYSKQYEYSPDDYKLASQLAEARERGFMTRDELVMVAKWKWRGGRTRQLAVQNTEEEVQEITQSAFAAKSERLRIGALLALKGVNWPMASVILHFAFPDRYPILDIRAMETVGGSTLYTFEKWLEYVKLCQATANQLGVTMRELDRALWSIDKERNPRRRKQT